jgi:hypothetical protein
MSFCKNCLSIVYLTYNIPPPDNITNIFVNWLNMVDRNDKVRIRIGVSVLCLILSSTSSTIFLQVIRPAAD